jgi:ERF superfamily protein
VEAPLEAPFVAPEPYVDTVTDIEHSEGLNELATALARAQADISHAKEDASNPHFRSAYATLASVIDACKLPLSKASIAVVQAPYNAGSLIGVSTMLIHSSGQWIKCKVAVRPVRFEAQAVGSVISYLRRYTLLSIIRMSQDDADVEPPASPTIRPEPKKEKKAAAPEDPETRAMREEFTRLKAAIMAAPHSTALNSLRGVAEEKMVKIKERSEEAYAQLDELFHTRGRQLGT